MPPDVVTSAHTVEYLSEALNLSPRRKQWLDERVQASGIQRRHTCVPEFMDGFRYRTENVSAATSYDQSMYSLEERMQRYEREALKLAEGATVSLLKRTGARLDEITHVIWVTCTGFAAPGPAESLADRLGLGDHVHHVQIGFMGCGAALQGLRLADAYCASDPDAVVLLLCVELCTLHFGSTLRSAEQMIIATHFADGAAAALISRRQIAPNPSLCLRSFCSLKLQADPGLLIWRLGDGAGFVMGLGRRLPKILADGVERLVARMPVDDPEEPSSWVIHPGGRAIVETIGEQLGLTSHDLSPSLETLAEFGNMSSPTVLFALERYDQAPTQGRLIAFGPGPSIEGMCWGKPQSGSPPS